MSATLKVIVGWIGAYLLGSLPPGLLWGWLVKHIDVRKHGSGRTGGTNVWRTTGFLPAFLTAISDALKGAAGIWLAHTLGLRPWQIALAGAFGVVGHNYSIFLNFSGGAGTMISIGIAAALWSTNLLILIPLGMIAGLLVGHASVASILVALLLPAVFVVRGEIAYALGFGVPAMLLTLWALRPNIRRLFKREERFLPIFKEKPPVIRISRHPPQHAEE